MVQGKLEPLSNPMSTTRNASVSRSQELRALASELRRELRVSEPPLWIESPFQALVVDCSLGGLGIETDEVLPVGTTWPIQVRSANRELVLLGSIRWARLICTKTLADGDVRPNYRSGIAFMEGRAIESWRLAVGRVLKPRGEGSDSRSRTVVRWKAPS